MSHNTPNLILGSHISLNKPNKYLLGVVQETVANKANCFMIFTGPPQNKKRIETDFLFLKEAQSLATQQDIDFSNCVVHAPYIINLCTHNQENRNFGIDFLIGEITRSLEIGIRLIVLHPGFHTGLSLQEGIENLVKSLDIVFEKTQDLDYFLCLETMAGKKNQVGKILEEIKQIIDGLKNKSKIGVCLDTCHLHDAGYDLQDKDGFLNKFDELIGIHLIKTIHLGDSMNVRGFRKDRHANLGLGHIGFDVLLSWAYDEYISTIPIIIETPYWKDLENDKKLVSPYLHEIKLLRSQKFIHQDNPKFLPIFNKLDH